MVLSSYFKQNMTGYFVMHKRNIFRSHNPISNNAVHISAAVQFPNTISCLAAGIRHTIVHIVLSPVHMKGQVSDCSQSPARLSNELCRAYRRKCRAQCPILLLPSYVQRNSGCERYRR